MISACSVSVFREKLKEASELGFVLADDSAAGGDARAADQVVSIPTVGSA